MKICIFCEKRFTNNNWKCPECFQSPAIVNNILSFAPQLALNNDGFDSIIFSKLAPLESKNFWFRSRNKLILWALQYYFSQRKTFLEIGCGTGFVLSAIERAFPQMEIMGSEIFTEGLTFASSRLFRSQLFQMDASLIPFENEFDVIGAFDVLEHIQNDHIVLQQIHKALTNEGGLLLTVPQHPWLWSQADEYAHHCRRYRANELKNKVEKAGFEILRMTSFFMSLLLPLIILSRRNQYNNKEKDKYDPMSEFKISKHINNFFEKILNFERYMIKNSVDFPLGGSLLLVAKKIK
jgi:SAM-dependent methyltransferase